MKWEFDHLFFKATLVTSVMFLVIPELHVLQLIVTVIVMWGIILWFRIGMSR